MQLSVVIIVKNEEENLRECLQSIRWADEIVVLDSGSEDRTVDIAKEFTPIVLNRSFRNYADQKNAAIDEAGGDWILVIDADERVSPELQRRIKQIKSQKKMDEVFAIKRKTYFLKRPLRFSGTQSDYPVRLFPRGKARFEQPVHERVVTDLPVHKIHEPMIHYTTPDIFHYRRKLAQYVPFEIRIMEQRKRRVHWWDPVVRPLFRFTKSYVLDLGILDGVAGLQFAGLAAYYDYCKFVRYLQQMKQKPS